MTKIKFLSALLVSICISLPTFAQILVVSDIDDTLKVSHVLNTYENLANGMKVQNHFLGMAHAFRSIEPHQLQEKLTFAYVSNAPERIMSESHSKFLRTHGFPTGTLHLRASSNDQEHKFRTIQSLIEKNQPRFVVLIGDNGEADPVVYAKIENKFPSLEIQTFIHQIYSVKSKVEKGQPLQPGQIGFATSVDLAGFFKDLELIPEVKYEDFIQTVVPRILAEKSGLLVGEISFPKWMDCRDFLNLSRTFDVRESNELLTQYQNKVLARCSQGL